MTELQKFCATTFLFCLLALGIGYLGAQNALEQALKREAQVQGMDWAHYIEEQLPHLDGYVRVDGVVDPYSHPTVDDFQGLLAGVFNVGHIFQIDYINIHCFCDISLTPEEVGLPPINFGADDAHDHEHDHSAEKKNGNIVTQKRLEHVFTGTKKHKELPSTATGPGKFPIDRAFVANLAAQDSDEIRIIRGQDELLPDTFATVYHPVSSDGKAHYVLRVLVNLDEQGAQYSSVLITGISLSLLLLLAAVGFPTLRYVQIMDRRQEADRRAAYLANYDVLTKLHNRNNFQETMENTLWACQEKNESALLFLFDLNGFKDVNDYFGHDVGDRLLQRFAEMLRQHVPEHGYVARLGGDEFVVVIGGIANNYDIDHTDHLSLPRIVSMPLPHREQTVTATISGGVVQFPRDGQNTSDLMQMADLALYAAKPNRAGEICVYTPEMKENLDRRLNLREEFRQALDCSQILPFYQPIVDMKTGEVDGFEALARWNHPTRGVLTPFVFEEALQDAEISGDLGRLMFAKIARDMATWTRMGVPFNKVALNVVNGDLKREDFAQHILDGLKSHKLDPSCLTIEVTENCLFGNDKETFLRHLQTLRAAGCNIALDDFGTGYSSITQLKELPINIVKIDKSFIEDILENKDDQSIISALRTLGETMRFDLVLEGVETEGQLLHLHDMGFALVQGYYFSRPVPSSQVLTFFEDDMTDEPKFGTG